MLRLHSLLTLLFALGCCLRFQSPDEHDAHVLENMEKMGKLMARWSRLHPVKIAQISEEDKEFLHMSLKHDDDHVLSIPELNGDDAAKLIEGDIIPSDEDIAELEELLREEESGITDGSKRIERAASHKPAKNWPDNFVPYIIGDGHDSTEIARIHAAIKTFNENTCIEFEEHPWGRGRKLEFKKVIKGCSTNYLGDGRTSYANHTIYLGPECFEINTIQHEIMHALGFGHTMSRSDRDDYMEYYAERVNPDPRTVFQFQVFPSHKFDNLSIPYEYNSVMHYGSNAGSQHGRPVLVPIKRDYIASVGGEHGPTFNDWKAINLRYNCDQHSGRGCRTSEDCKNNGYPHPRKCRKCVCPIFFMGSTCDYESPKSYDLLPEEEYTIKALGFSSSHGNETRVATDFSNYEKYIRMVKVPEGRKIRITIKEIDNVDCPRECIHSGVEITDEDLSLVGKRFCCKDRVGYSFVSKSNVVGFQGYAAPGYNFSGVVGFTVEPLDASSTELPITEATSDTTVPNIDERTTPEPSTSTEGTPEPETTVTSETVQTTTEAQQSEESTTAAETEGTDKPASTETPVSTVASSTNEPPTESSSPPTEDSTTHEIRFSYPWSDSTTTYPAHEYSIHVHVIYDTS